MERSQLTDGFTTREYFGTPAQLAIGLVALLVPPLFALYTLDKYPTLDPNPRLLFVVSLAVVAVAWMFCILRRKALMSWGEKAPYLMWVGTLALAVLPGMVAVGVVLIANAALDQSAPVEIRSYTTSACYGGKTVRVALSGQAVRSVHLDIPVRECLTASAGDSVRLTVRSGALGIAWVESHSFLKGP